MSEWVSVSVSESVSEWVSEWSHIGAKKMSHRVSLSLGDSTQNKYATLTNCDLWEVGEEFSRKPYALAVQEGSPLKNELSSV